MRKRLFSLLVEQLSILFVVFIRLIKRIVGVDEDHVDKLFEERVFEVEFEVFAKDLIGPEGGEYFIGVVTVLEFFVELVGAACVGDAAIEANEAVGEIPADDGALLEGLMDEASLAVVEETKDHFDVAC